MPASEQPIIPPTAVTAPVTEVKAPETTTPPPQPDQNERWAQLARKEKSLRALERDLKAKEATFKAAPPPQPDWKERIKADALGMFTEAGLSHEELVNLVLNAKPEDMQIRQLKSEIQALKTGQTEIKTAAEQNQKTAYDQAIKQISHQVKTLVDGNEAFETIAHERQTDAVVALIEETYKDEGVLMTVEEAAKQVEDYLVDRAMSLTKLKKIQSKLALPSNEPAPQEMKQGTIQKQSSTPQVIPRVPVASPTLTHAVTAVPSKTLTSREKRERAIAAFKGQLK